jgi:serralysin
LGNDSITGVGNGLANTISGNDSPNIIEGGGGGDTLTGLGGADTFRYANLGDSLLNQYDRITELQVGVDQIDGPSQVITGKVRQLGTVSSLSQSAIQQVLTTSQFVANGAASFTFGSRTFLALNDAIAGFNSSRDSIIEITGYSGNLGQLGII